MAAPPAVTLLRDRSAAAALCVIKDGEVVLDESVGAAPDTPFLLLSAGKPFVAVLVHRLAERGVLSLDAPMAQYWPAFGQRGKDGITVRHVLQHRAGLPVAAGLVGDALRATDWTQSIRALEQARPRTAPGAVPAYHILSFGFLLGELIQRVTELPLSTVVQSELFEPLGMRDTYLGLPAAQLHRAPPITSPLLGPDPGVRRALFNHRAFRQAAIPAATFFSTARDLARFYQGLLTGAVLSPASLAEATRPSTAYGEIDTFLRIPIRWAAGFQLGGPVPGGRPVALGRGSSVETFGHNGSNACVGWADPTRGLAMAYLTNRLLGRPGFSPHQCAVSDAVLASAYGSRAPR